jgi:hypothetical protein
MAPTECDRLRYENSANFAASRVFLGAVFLFAVLLILRRPLRPTNWLLTMVVGLFGMTGSIGLAIWALAGGGAGKTPCSCTPCPCGYSSCRGSSWGNACAELNGCLSSWPWSGCFW